MFRKVVKSNKRIFNKKGQTIGFTELLLITLAVVGIVIVGLGTYYGWEKVFSIFNASPDLEIVFQTCSATVNLGSYCDSPIKLGGGLFGGDNWANCEYVKSQNPNSGIPNRVIDCDYSPYDNFTEMYCKQLQADVAYDGKDSVNGVACPKAEVETSVA
jgi:hypothetical protein